MRYHFDIHAPLFLDRDPEGEEFSSMEAACEHVLETMRQYFKNRDGKNLNLVEDSVIEVSDENGNMRFIPLTEVLAELRHGRSDEVILRRATLN